jgi:hypothetical protein
VKSRLYGDRGGGGVSGMGVFKADMLGSSLSGCETPITRILNTGPKNLFMRNFLILVDYIANKVYGRSD